MIKTPWQHYSVSEVNVIDTSGIKNLYASTL